MKASDENFVSMIIASLANNQNQPASVKDSMPGYNDGIDLLTSKNNEIASLSGTQTSTIVGFQMDKSESKSVLTEKTMTIVFATKAYAIAANDTVLEEKMKALSKSKLLKMRDSRTAYHAEDVLTIAAGIQAELEPYGITEDVLGKANHALDKFRTDMAKPRNNIVARGLIVKRINVLLKECRTILYQLDTLVNSIKATQPEFASSYFENRRVIDLHGSVLSVRGFVTDANGNPIEKVIVTAAKGERTTKTSARGYFEFKNLPLGIDVIKFSKVLFVETSQTIGVVKGERVQLNIALKNAQANEDVA